MKKFLSAVLFGAVSFSLAAYPVPLAGDKRPPRVVEYSRPQKITAPDLEIIVPRGSSKVVRFAARELQTFLAQRLKGNVAVRETPSANKRSLILGLNDFSRRAGIQKKQLCRDSFFIRSYGNDIIIAGADDPETDPEKALKGNKYSHAYERGTLFGVYDFLERFAGVRFYFPGKYGVIVPEGDMYLPEKINIFERPDLEVRNSGLEESVFTESPSVIARPYLDRNNFATHRGQISPLKFLAGYRMRYSSQQLPNCHGLNHLELGRRFAEKNPEFFAMDAAGKRLTDPKRPHPFQLCFSSGVRKIILDDVEAYFRKESPFSRGLKPHIYGKPINFWPPHGFAGGVADMQPQDAFFMCRCSKCSKYKSRQEISDMVWDLALDAAENLKKKKLPGMIQMMSYYPYDQFPKRLIPDNFIVLLAVSGPWRLDYKVKMQAQDRVVEKWSERCRKSLILWNYCGKYGSAVMPDIPHHTPRRIAHYYKRVAPYIAGSKLLLSGDYYLFAAMNYYMYGKIMWDLSTEPDSLLDEYYRLMFGAGAGEMKKVFESLEENWISANGRMVDTPLGPAAVAASQYELFEVFYSPAFIQSMEKSFDRAEKATAADKKSFERVKFMRWNFLDRIKRASEDYFRHSSALKFFKAHSISMATEKVDWSKAAPVWLQRPDGKEGFSTVFKSAVTPGFLKFRVECTEPEPEKVIAAPGDSPERLWDKDGIELFIDPSCDRKNYVHIIATPAKVTHVELFKMAGSRFIAVKGKIPEVSVSVKYDNGKFVYDVGVRRKDLMGFDGKKAVFNLIRNQKKSAYQARYSWSPFLGKSNHDPLKFGTLEFSDPASKNLLKDGDFSAPQKGRNVFGPWITNWNIPAGCSVAHDHTTFISGCRSLRMSSDATVKWFQIANTVELEAGIRYRLSYFVKLHNVKGKERESGFCVNLWSDRNRWFPAVKLTGTTPWIRQSFEFTTGKNEKKTFKIKPFMHSCSGTVYIDKVTLEKIRQ